MRHDPAEIIPIRGSVWMTREEWRRSWKPWLRGTALGFPIGSLPAGGAEIPTFLSYSLEKRLTKHPEEFGQGAIEGVAGPEAANNASAAGVLVPLLTLGLPTSATAAILLVAFQRYGLNPGPPLFDKDPDLVWGLIASLYIGNVMLLVLNLPLAGLWVRLLAIPRPLLYAGILVFAGLGTYSAPQLHGRPGRALRPRRRSGFLMRRFDIPVAPAVVGVILGPEPKPLPPRPPDQPRGLLHLRHPPLSAPSCSRRPGPHRPPASAPGRTGGALSWNPLSRHELSEWTLTV